MKINWSAIRLIWQKDYVRIISTFLFFLIVFSITYFSIDRVNSLDDHFFHIRYAQMIRENDAMDKPFHWTYFSQMSQENDSWRFNPLFYYFLEFFTFFDPLFLGIKLFGVIGASFVFTIFYTFLLKIKVKRAFLFTLMFFALANVEYIWRLLMARSFVIAAALLLLEIYLLYRKKYLAAVFLMILYPYWHMATSIFPLGVAIIYILFHTFYVGKFDRKYASVLLGSIAGSFLFGLFMHVNFFTFTFSFLEWIYNTFFQSILTKKVNIAEGAELYPLNALDFVKSNPLLLATFTLSAVFEILQYISSKKTDEKINYGISSEKQAVKGTLFFLSILFLLGVLISRRNIDYFILFSIAYITLSLNIFIKAANFRNAIISRSFTPAFLILLVYFFTANALGVHDKIASANPYNKIQGAAEWLRDNTQPGEIVFHPTWNWFTLLFYYNTHNYYIVGIEPRSLYDYNSELYWKWWNISSYGYVCNQEDCSNLSALQRQMLRNDERKKKWFDEMGNAVADEIVQSFHSHYIITSVAFKNLNDLMDNNPRFKKVFTDTAYNEFFVYRVD